MTVAEFNAQAQGTQSALERIAGDGLQAVRDLVERARDRIIGKLAEAPSEYDVWFYTHLQLEAERLIGELRGPLTAQLARDAEQAANAIDTAYESLQHFGIEVGGVGWTWAQVETLTRARLAERISNLVAGGQIRIRDALQQGMLGTLTPFEVQKTIAGNLAQAEGFGPLWYRADMIWTTEVNGTAGRAMIDKAQAIERRNPGKMLKRWLHSGNTRWPREHHIRLGQLPPQPIPEPYDVGGIPAHGPHAENLSAEEVIKCGCTLILEFAEDQPHPRPLS